MVARPAWTVVDNTENLQAVAFRNGRVMAAFYAPGILHWNKNVLTVDKPCMVQLKGTRLHVSDPLHRGGELHLTLNKKKYKVALTADGTTTAVSL